MFCAFMDELIQIGMIVFPEAWADETCVRQFGFCKNQAVKTGGGSGLSLIENFFHSSGSFSTMN
jgi:hypothetical protein